MLVATSAGDACAEFVDMFDPAAPTQLFTSLAGVVDLNLPRHYVLLHDLKLGPAGSSLRDSALQNMHSTFNKAACHAVDVHSSQYGSEAATVADAVKAMLETGLLSSLDIKVGELHETCESSKKGFRNAVKGWLGFGRKSAKKEKTDLPQEPHERGVGVVYSLSHSARTYKRLLLHVCLCLTSCDRSNWFFKDWVIFAFCCGTTRMLSAPSRAS
jgi:hypothetical protein